MLPQWLKGSIRSVLGREEGSNSVSLLSLMGLQWPYASHTKSHLTCHVSFHIRCHRPCRCMQKEHHPMELQDCGCLLQEQPITIWMLRKAIPFACAETAMSVLALRTLSWVHLSQAPFLLCSLSKAGSTSRPSEGKYYSQRIKKKKKNPTKHHICDFICLLVLSYPTISQSMYRGDASPCLHQTWKRRAHASRPHPAQIASFPTLLVLN